MPKSYQETVNETFKITTYEDAIQEFLGEWGSFQVYHDYVNKKIQNAIILSKKIPLPKNKFNTKVKCYPSKIDHLFENPQEEDFTCPHCKKVYLARYDDEGNYIYEDELNYLPSKCTNCQKLMAICPIIKRFNDWVITTYGIECLDKYYPIEKYRLYEVQWLPHMAEKNWINLNDFACAFEWAKHFFSPLHPGVDLFPKKLKSYQTKESYKEYLLTPHWLKTKERAINFYKSCVICGSDHQLNVHHRDYKHLWKERITKDLVILCRSCHEKYHGIIENNYAK